MLRLRANILACCMLLVFSLDAQTKHAFYVSVAGNAGMLMEGTLTSALAGGGGSAGLGYEFSKGHFLMNIGIDGEMQRLRNSVGDFKRDYSAVDTEGDAFSWHHSFHERTDEADVVNIGIPLLAGGKYEYVYFMAGPKIVFNVWGRSRCSSVVDATATYEGLIGEFEEMENHALYTGRNITEPWSNNRFKINLRVAGEVGLVLNGLVANEKNNDKMSKAGMELRLGVFAEAGVLNLRNQDGSAGLVEYKNVDTWPGVDFTQTYVFRTAEAKETYLTDVEVGVKLRMLFGMKEKKKCVICADNYL